MRAELHEAARGVGVKKLPETIDWPMHSQPEEAAKLQAIFSDCAGAGGWLFMRPHGDFVLGGFALVPLAGLRRGSSGRRGAWSGACLRAFTWR